MNDRPIRTKGKNGHVTHWWQTLMAVPEQKSSAAYQRLRRVWFDHTRCLGSSLEKSTKKVYESKRHHEFQKPDHETHLTTSFWENFVLFPADIWLPRLYKLAGLPLAGGRELKCQWSYEWEGYRPKAGDAAKLEQGMCDVVIEHQGRGGKSGVLVVEAKNLRKEPGEKEKRFDYYLSIRDFERFGDNASLLYLVDESVRDKSVKVLGALPSNVSLITWQQLAGLQIDLARTLEASAAVRNFVAGAIQFQYSQHDIRPINLSAPYLEEEMSLLEMDALPMEEKQKMADHKATLWKL